MRVERFGVLEQIQVLRRLLEGCGSSVESWAFLIALDPHRIGRVGLAAAEEDVLEAIVSGCVGTAVVESFDTEREGIDVRQRWVDALEEGGGCFY